MVQLSSRGNNVNLIHELAEDALILARLRSALRVYVRSARNFVAEYCRLYDQKNGSTIMNAAIDQYENEINEQIKSLDQTVKEILQLVIILRSGIRRRYCTDCEGIRLGLHQRGSSINKYRH